MNTAPNALTQQQASTTLPTAHGTFRAVTHFDENLGVDHIALVAPGTRENTGALPLVRVHSECLTGEAFGSLKCECGAQLDESLRMIHEQGGVLIYLRGHEGRGIGLANKIRAYRLQEQGADTLDANLTLGLPADARDYSAATVMLRDLGFTRVRLLTNNPNKVSQLEASGIEVAERVSLIVGVGDQNRGYLDTKRERMGHMIPA